jgi:glycosyltransferase involved in cell wall biosynthesis
VRVFVIIPARNEAASIGNVLDAIPADCITAAIVVNNDSDDATAEIARRHGATVLDEPRHGYGAACLRGLDHLRSERAGIVVFLDADYSDYPEEMHRLIAPIVAGRADLVIGSRVIGRRERWALAPHARAGNWLATRLIRLLFGVAFTDLGPFRAVRLDRLRQLGMRDRDFGWTVEMQVKAIRQGLCAIEVPVSYRRRIGRSKISGTVSGTLRAGSKILWTIVREWGSATGGKRSGRTPPATTPIERRDLR